MARAHDNLVILGLGLIGGSLARALRQSGFCKRFIGYGYREPSLQRGVELGVIDEFTLDLAEAVERADIMVICTPTLTAANLMRDLLPLATTEGAGSWSRETLFWQSGHYQVVRHGDWKLQVTARPDKQWLFNLADDPTEQNNLADSRPDKRIGSLSLEMKSVELIEMAFCPDKIDHYIEVCFPTTG